MRRAIRRALRQGIGVAQIAGMNDAGLIFMRLFTQMGEAMRHRALLQKQQREAQDQTNDERTGEHGLAEFNAL